MNLINPNTNSFKTEYIDKSNKHNFSESTEYPNHPFTFLSTKNIKVYYNQLYKRVKQKSPSNILIINLIVHKFQFIK